jgi:hypothetical protein
MAIFGWRTIKQAEAYTRAAGRKRLAGAAMHLLGTDGDRKPLTSDPQTSAMKEKGRKAEQYQWPFAAMVPRRGPADFGHTALKLQ